MKTGGCLLLCVLAVFSNASIELKTNFTAGDRGIRLLLSASDGDAAAIELESSLWTPVMANGREHTQRDGSLIYISSETSTGSDILGAFASSCHLWRLASQASAGLSTCLRTYTPTLAVTSLKVLTPLHNTSRPSSALPIAAFPTLSLAATSSLSPSPFPPASHSASPSATSSSSSSSSPGVAYWHGLWPQPVVVMGLDVDTLRTRLPQRHDGPILFSAPQRGNGTAPRISMVIAPLNRPLTSTFQASSQDDAIWFGPAAEITSLPEKYTLEYCVVVGAGATRTMEALGGVLRTFWTPPPKIRDTSVDSLSLWTDNGAYMFWNNDGKKALDLPEVVLPQALAALRNHSLSVPLLQLDGWWMNASTTAPDASLFPSGWAGFLADINASGGTELLLYKAFFSCEYDLFDADDVSKVQSSKGPCYPAANSSLVFYRRFFHVGKGLQMGAYETDFLSDHLLPTPGLAGLHSGLADYFSGMAQAGLEADIAMQWCMPTAGIVMSSIDKAAVTNGRASVDYACEGPQDMNVTWMPNYFVGVAELLFWTVGLAPSKDIFRSRAHEGGGPPSCGYQHDNPNYELDVILAVLSTGPVGVGDGPGMSNISLLASTARADGVLLKPDKPATAIDATFVPTALKQKAVIGFLPMTQDGDCSVQRPCSPMLIMSHSTIPVVVDGHVTQQVWHHAVSIQLGRFVLQTADMYPTPTADSALVSEFRWTRCGNGTTVSGTCMENISYSNGYDVSSGPSRLDGGGANAWRLFRFFPTLPAGWHFVGEEHKIVSVARARFANISVTSPGSGAGGDADTRSCISWTLVGSFDEQVRVSVVTPRHVHVTVAMQQRAQHGEVCEA